MKRYKRWEGSMLLFEREKAVRLVSSVWERRRLNVEKANARLTFCYEIRGKEGDVFAPDSPVLPPAPGESNAVSNHVEAVWVGSLLGEN